MYLVRKITLLVILSSIAFTIGYVFWQQELKYAAPTPIPSDYKHVPVYTPVGRKLFTSEELAKPVHLHFYNPDCPCSKFNLDHFKNLVAKYKGAIDFYVVITDQAHYASVKNKFDGDVTVLVDEDEKMADACGVYSTPQAVILNKQGELFYRGNYNKARYCTDKNSNYAELALDAILAGNAAPDFGQLATTSYGCEITEKPQSLNFLNF